MKKKKPSLALRTIERKGAIRFSLSPKEFVLQRMRASTDNLNRAGRLAARVEIANEAMARVAELAYVVEADWFVNVDPVDGRLLVPVAWGDHGWRHYGLRYREGRTLRTILWQRQCAYRAGGRPPLFVYDEDTRCWAVNLGDYGSHDAAVWWLQKSPITLAEWRTAIATMKSTS